MMMMAAAATAGGGVVHSSRSGSGGIIAGGGGGQHKFVFSTSEISELVMSPVFAVGRKLFRPDSSNSSLCKDAHHHATTSSLENGRSKAQQQREQQRVDVMPTIKELESAMQDALLMNHYRHANKSSSDTSADTINSNLNNNQFSSFCVTLFNPPGDGHCLLRCYLAATADNSGVQTAMNDDNVRLLRSKLAQCLRDKELSTADLQARLLGERGRNRLEAPSTPAQLQEAWLSYCNAFAEFDKAVFAGEGTLHDLRDHIWAGSTPLKFMIFTVAGSSKENCMIQSASYFYSGSEEERSSSNAAVIPLIYLQELEHYFVVLNSTVSLRGTTAAGTLRNDDNHPSKPGTAANDQQDNNEDLYRASSQSCTDDASEPESSDNLEPDICDDPHEIPNHPHVNEGESEKAAGKRPAKRRTSFLLQPAEAAVKKPRVTLDLNTKMALITDRENKVSISKCMQKYNVVKGTVQRIFKERNKIRHLLANNPKLKTMKHTDIKGKFPELETVLIAFIFSLRKQGFPITSSLITEKAREFAIELSIENFTGSDSWLQGFIKRNGFSSISSIAGQARSSKLLDVADEIRKLRLELQEYDVNNIYNVDETGLFYRLLPKRSYVFHSGKNKSVRGIKQMNDEDRLSIYVCTNASGTHKVPLTVIGTAKNPSILGKGKERDAILSALNIKYTSQVDAWSDVTTMKYWLWDVFAASVRDKVRAKEKIALVMDNCGPHDFIRDCSEDLAKSNIKVFFLPKKVTTSLHQPMDQGVISALKRQYRFRLVEDWSSLFLRRKSLQALSDKKKAGTLGLAEGKPPHLLDAFEILSDVWTEQTTAPSLARCWIASDILSGAQQRELIQSLGKKNQAYVRRIPDVEEELQREVQGLHHGKAQLPDWHEGSTETVRSAAIHDTSVDTSPTIQEVLGPGNDVINQREIAERLRQLILSKAERDEVSDNNQSRSSPSNAANATDMIDDLFAEMRLHTTREAQLSMIEKWLDVEEDSEVRQALEEDHLDNVIEQAKKAAADRARAASLNPASTELNPGDEEELDENIQQRPAPAVSEISLSGVEATLKGLCEFETGLDALSPANSPGNQESMLLLRKLKLQFLRRVDEIETAQRTKSV